MGFLFTPFFSVFSVLRHTLSPLLRFRVLRVFLVSPLSADRDQHRSQSNQQNESSHSREEHGAGYFQSKNLIHPGAKLHFNLRNIKYVVRIRDSPHINRMGAVFRKIGKPEPAGELIINVAELLIVLH